MKHGLILIGAAALVVGFLMSKKPSSSGAAVSTGFNTDADVQGPFGGFGDALNGSPQRSVILGNQAASNNARPQIASPEASPIMSVHITDYTGVSSIQPVVYGSQPGSVYA